MRISFFFRTFAPEIEKHIINLKREHDLVVHIRMDTITKSIFTEFIEQFNYSKLSEDDAFERFAIYSVISQHLKNDTVSKDMLENMCIGGGNDWGLDGFVIIVNGRYVSTEEEIQNLLETNGFLNVEMFAIQAKTSPKINSALVGQALDGLQTLFQEIITEGSLILPISSDEVDHIRDLVKFIYSKCASFAKGINPIVHFSYVYCGTYQPNNDVESKFFKTNSTLQTYNLISGNLRSEIVDKNNLKSLYDATKRKNEATIKIEQKLVLPEVDKIEESYLCIIPFGEIKKLLIDAEGNLNLSIFEDNVRAFQGENTVNKAIAESIENGEMDLFTAMNNGITIIAKDIDSTGLSVTISDYQIVNGCQTCHILFGHKDFPNIDNLKLIVKIVSSQDKEIKDKIIVGNNSQTEVKREQLISLLEIQRQIEAYYYAQKKFEKLYYERRSKQYRSDARIRKDQIVTIPFQIKAFVSMILGKPEKVGGYYGSIIEQFDKNGQRVFLPDTNPALYYTSALAAIKMEQMFNDKVITREYKKIKYHVLYAFRLLTENMELPKYLNSKDTSKYCDHICSMLVSEEKCKELFKAAITLVDAALQRKPKDSDRQSTPFTKSIDAKMAEINRLKK